MQVAVVFALLVTLGLGSPVPQRTENTRPSLQDADWKERLTGLNRQTQNAAPVEEEPVQAAQPLPEHLDQATDHSAVKVDQEKKAVNWWEKDHTEVAATAVEPEVQKAEEVVAAVPLPAAEEPVENAPVAAVAVPLPAAEQPVEAAPAAVVEEEVVQKVSQTDVEATWNKVAARQEKEPAETKPWWENDGNSSSSSAAPEAAVVPKEEEAAAVAAVADVTESVAAVNEEAAAPAVAALENENKNFQPLKPHHSVNQPVAAHHNNDD